MLPANMTSMCARARVCVGACARTRVCPSLSVCPSSFGMKDKGLWVNPGMTVSLSVAQNPREFAEVQDTSLLLMNDNA